MSQPTTLELCLRNGKILLSKLINCICFQTRYVYRASIYQAYAHLRSLAGKLRYTCLCQCNLGTN